MDGFDYVERVKLISSGFNKDVSQRPKEVFQFVETCRKLGLPLSASKSLIRGLSACTLGGEIDGVAGKISQSRDKTFKYLCKSLTLLSFESVSQVTLQHWAGMFCFGAGFRRPLFSVVQDIFPFIQDPRWDKVKDLPFPPSVLDEILLGAILMPLACTNIRAPIRFKISCSDASEQGGGGRIFQLYKWTLSFCFGNRRRLAVKSHGGEPLWK